MSVSLIGVLVSAIAAAACLGRIAFLFAYRVPVLGTVTRHDYDPALRRFEAGWNFYASGGPEDINPFREVWARVTYRYKDVDYLNDVRLTVGKGAEPDRLVQLWL